ncbi:MAG: hypothetical protein WCE51_09460 [Chthoniobacterales bacterium]
MDELIRQVIRELRFERELSSLIHDAIPAHQFVEAAEYLLARDPLVETPTDDMLVWAMPMAPIGGEQVVLYYAFDNSMVWLL